MTSQQVMNLSLVNVQFKSSVHRIVNLSSTSNSRAASQHQRVSSAGITVIEEVRKDALIVALLPIHFHFCTSFVGRVLQ